MIAIIYRSKNHTALERMVARFIPGPPVLKDGRRVGTLLRVWREGNNLMAEFEIVPEEVSPDSTFDASLE